MKELIKDYSRLIIYDPMIEYSSSTYKIFNRQSDLIRFLKEKGDSFFRVVYIPDDPQADFHFICNLVYCMYDVVFACEEIDMGTSSNYTPPPLVKIICQGRHKGISHFGTTRRPTEVPKLLTSQANKLYIFKTHEPRDVDYFKQVMGENSEQIRNLKEYQYLYYNVDNGETKIQ